MWENEGGYSAPAVSGGLPVAVTSGGLINRHSAARTSLVLKLTVRAVTRTGSGSSPSLTQRRIVVGWTPRYLLNWGALNHSGASAGMRGRHGMFTDLRLMSRSERDSS